MTSSPCKVAVWQCGLDVHIELVVFSLAGRANQCSASPTCSCSRGARRHVVRMLVSHASPYGTCAAQCVRVPFLSRAATTYAILWLARLAHIIFRVPQQGELSDRAVSAPLFFRHAVLRLGDQREEGQLGGRVYGPTVGLSKNVHCMSASPIHIHYNHAPSRDLRSLSGRCCAFIIFNCPEVVRLEKSAAFDAHDARARARA